MVEFDQLPQTSRSLILATLALDITSRNCRNIFDLALKRNQSIQDVWRDVCRRTAQPRCTIPVCVLESRYTTTGTLLADPAAAGADMHHRSSAAPPIASSGAGRPVSEFQQFGDLLAVEDRTPVATAAPSMNAAPCRTVQGQAAGGRRRMLVTGIGVTLLLGLGFAVASSSSRSILPGAGLAEPIRIDKMPDGTRASGAKSSAPVVHVPPPEGTLRRMNAISKSFSKQ